MILRAKLFNPTQKEKLHVEIAFPIKDYEDTYLKLAESGLGDTISSDCLITEINSDYSALLILKGENVNVDELDYLAKRLDSFGKYEAVQFNAMASALEFTDIKDLINLTFCCQNATVITDFSDHRAIGRQHFLNMSGGNVPVNELDSHDTAQIAMDLIQSETGIITPYGVVYCNDMKYEQSYSGWAFPAYACSECLFAVEARSKSVHEAGSTWLYLPMPDVCLGRALERGWIDNPDYIGSLECTVVNLPFNVLRWTDMAFESPETLNQAACAIKQLNNTDMELFCTAVELAEPRSTPALCKIAERLDLFEYAPGIRTAEEYGRHIISETGNFECAENPDEPYDYAGYGQQRLDCEQGKSLESGYIRYIGSEPLETIFASEDRTQGQGKGMSMTMGGM